MRIELTVKIAAPLSKGTRGIMKNLQRAVVVYNQTDDATTQTFLTENEQFLVCTENENAAFHADLFHLALCRQTQYQCKCTSCLTSIVCIGKKGEVYFCPHHVQESMLGKIDDEGNYFENENFLRLLNEEIQKRNTCKSTCKYYPVCRGGCALENICETFKQEYPVCMESAKDTLTKKTPLNELPPYLTEAILKGVSHGNVKTLNE
jgi:radical SAM protein with 4Fe4S-binding SPASM domain